MDLVEGRERRSVGFHAASPAGRGYPWPMPIRVVKYQTTPNPNAVKVVVDRLISDVPKSFRTREEGAGDPLAQKFFAVAGVTSLLFNADWFTVNKSPEAAWPAIKKQIERVLSELN